MKKYISRVLGIGFLLICIILSYLIVSNKLDKNVENISEQIKNNDDKKNANMVSEEQPEGIIYHLKEKFVWKTEPLVDVYDPENKIGKNEVYGCTVDAVFWQTECTKRVNEYLKNNDVSEDKKGMEIYNLSAVHEMNVKVEIVPYNREIKVSNLKIYDDISQFNDEYFVDDSYQFIKKHLDNKDKAKIYQYNEEEKKLYAKEMKDGDVKFITVDITVDAYSNWVEDITTVPELVLTDVQEDKVLVSDQIGYTFGENEDFEISDAVYFDIGLYDLKNPEQNNIQAYPMRKGESLKFTCGYFIPESLLDNCMLLFYTPFYTEDYYYDPYKTLISLK